MKTDQRYWQTERFMFPGQKKAALGARLAEPIPVQGADPPRHMGAGSDDDLGSDGQKDQRADTKTKEKAGIHDNCGSGHGKILPSLRFQLKNATINESFPLCENIHGARGQMAVWQAQNSGLEIA